MANIARTTTKKTNRTIAPLIPSPMDEQTIPAVATPFVLPTLFALLEEDIPRQSPMIDMISPTSESSINSIEQIPRMSEAIP